MLSIQQFEILTRGLKETYQRDKFLQSQDSMVVWYEYLKDIDYNILSMAIQKYICNNKFAPTIADLRELAVDIVIDDKEWGDGWKDVCLAIRKIGYYEEKKALESMDPLTRKTVENLGWHNLCMSDNIMTDRANFRDLYNTYAKREKEMMKLPAGVRQGIEMATNNNMIEMK